MPREDEGRKKKGTVVTIRNGHKSTPRIVFDVNMRPVMIGPGQTVTAELADHGVDTVQALCDDESTLMKMETGEAELSAPDPDEERELRERADRARRERLGAPVPDEERKR